MNCNTENTFGLSPPIFLENCSLPKIYNSKNEKTYFWFSKEVVGAFLEIIQEPKPQERSQLPLQGRPCELFTPDVLFIILQTIARIQGFPPFSANRRQR